MKRTWSQIDDRLESDRTMAGPSGTGTTVFQTIASTSGLYIKPYDPPPTSSSTTWTSSSFLALSSISPVKPSPYAFTRPHIHTTQIEDMRSLSLRGMFARKTAVTSSIPGRISIAFPMFNHGDRAQSEPLQSRVESDDVDVEMEAPEPVLRAQSEYIVRIPQEDWEASTYDTQRPLKRDTNDDVMDEEEELLEEIEEDESQSISQRPPRAPSPAATEIEEPESQDVVMDIQARGVKVRDFAFVIPDVPLSASSSAPPNHSSFPSIATTAQPYTPATEIFDQYKGLAEVEYRWTQPERRYPIDGRTSRRLLDIGWLSQVEWEARAHPVDIEDLRKHDARPIYPWRPFRWSMIPGIEQRRSMMIARAGMFNQLDRIRTNHEDKEARRAYEEAAAAALKARMEQEAQIEHERAAALAARASPTRNKRRLGTLDENAEVDTNTTSDVVSSIFPVADSTRVGDAKKRRLTPEPSSSLTLQPPQPTIFHPHPCSQPIQLAPPTKQYPAPLHTYNPAIYPEAASIIESSSQSASQPRPVVPERSDTPPLDEDDNRMQAEAAASASPGRGNKLVHPRERKAMQRGLSRTQTFAQL